MHIGKTSHHIHLIFFLILVFHCCSLFASEEHVYRGEKLEGLVTEERYPKIEKATRIFLIRHGETDWNVEGRPQGWEDIPLNDHGKEQVAYLGYCFSGLPIGAVYSSVLLRAMETAKAISIYHPSSRRVYDSALRFYDPIKRHERPKIISEEEWEASIAEEIVLAATAYLKHLFQTYPGENVVLVTHGKVIKHLVIALSEGKISKVKIDNAATIRVLAGIDGVVLE